jgi:uncharacterized protein
MTGLLTDTLDLLEWKRRVFELYAEIRRTDDPAAAWDRWRQTRDELFRSHPQSPLPSEARVGFGGLDYFPYDARLRFVVEVEPCEPRGVDILGSAATRLSFTLAGVARCDAGDLELYWLDGYGGGLFLPFGDATNGSETYGGGRYLLDTVKGADLGVEDGEVVLDFNFAYNPSCSYDDRWACPLPPPENRLDLAIRAGERSA